MKILAYLVFGLDKVLYNVFGVVTPIRRAYWRRRAKELQKALDYQHTFVSERNACRDVDHTGKYYVDNYHMIDSVYILNHIGEIQDSSGARDSTRTSFTKPQTYTIITLGISSF